MVKIVGTRLRILSLAIVLAVLSVRENAAAQAQCVTFSEARKLGLSNLRPAGAVKAEVEARTGGKVVSFLICKPGPTYRLTVLAPGGTVSSVSVPAR